MVTIEFHPLRLPEWTFIPIKIHPTHTVENGLNGLVGGTALVGVFDAKHEASVLLPCKEPVEQSRPHAADVKKAGRTGRKSDSNLTHSDVRALVV